MISDEKTDKLNDNKRNEFGNNKTIQMEIDYIYKLNILIDSKTQNHETAI
jgi:hypothetical protein